MHHRVVDVIDRPGEFAADQIVREIGGQSQIGEAVEQVEHEEQVGRHAVAMGFDMHGDAGLLGQPPPAFEQRNAVGEPARPDVGLQVDVIGAELADQIEHRLQIVHRLRIALRLPDHAVRMEEARDLAREGRIDEADAGAVKPGIADHRELGLQRPFVRIGQPPLHRPERLQDTKLLRHGSGPCRHRRGQFARRGLVGLDVLLIGLRPDPDRHHRAE
ncbi:hypothetical protein CI1B_83000 [Bradyrhizobium ivorense]|uniref:Uncharacterized protein n=1 Tax=Bradyrhizobium ivorense TaxID=2511166 RepID=A0A508U0P8_9BRAD|nr:hypothetical protein CI1B_83000 [Bradyrhizobium ivorense]